MVSNVFFLLEMSSTHQLNLILPIVNFYLLQQTHHFYQVTSTRSAKFI